MKELLEIIEDGIPVVTAAQAEERVASSRAAKIRAAEESGELGFASPYLISATLPHSQLPRRNGEPETEYSRKTPSAEGERPWCALTLAGSKRFGIAAGSMPRLFLAWLQTEVVRTGEPVLDIGKSKWDFAARVGVCNDKPTLDRLITTVHAIYETTWRLERDIFMPDGSTTHEKTRFNILDQITLALPDEPRQRGIWDSNITVHPDLYQDLTVGRRRKPFKMAALRGLARSPLAMDLYLWLATVAPNLRADFQDFTISALQEQFGTLITDPSTFRYRLKKQTQEVAKFYPELKVSWPRKKLRVFRSPPHVGPKNMAVFLNQIEARKLPAAEPVS